jgi:hypothetical protein
MNLLELDPLIKKFRSKFLHGEVTFWSVQHYTEGDEDVKYFPPKCSICTGKEAFYCKKHKKRSLDNRDLLEHFNPKISKIGRTWRGSIALSGKYQDNRAKFFCVDCDSEESLKVIEDLLLPELDRLRIDYIYEYSGNSYERKAHIWFLCDCDLDILRKFIDQLFSDLNIDIRKFKLELYPTHKPNFVIRLPGGHHLRSGIISKSLDEKRVKINPIKFKDEISNSPEFILKVFSESCKQVSEDYIKSLIRHTRTKIFDRSSRKKLYVSQFKFVPRDLKLPSEELPPVIKELASNCQAINKLIEKGISDRFIDDRGWEHHIGGRLIANLAKFNDIKARSRGVFSDEGRKWFRSYVKENRNRTDKTHNWLIKEELEESQLISKCETWHKEFNLCEGCPFRNRVGFTNPKSLLYGIKVRKEKLRSVELVSSDFIRENTFKKIKTRINALIANKWSRDVLIASPQGSGKSQMIGELAVELAKQGKNILIAVPTANLAFQHRKFIESQGQKAFILMSHKNIFSSNDEGKSKFGLDFQCPFYTEIQGCEQLGVSSSLYKKEYCKECPFIEKCPYPQQYKQVVDPKYKIVIIQHAHFSCRETLFSILRNENGENRFDALFVDEAFIDSLLKEIRPTESEITGIERFIDEIPWASNLFNWLKDGGYPEGKIIAKERHLEVLRKHFEEHLLGWNIPDYIRYFNSGFNLDKDLGLLVFFQVPNIPVRVFTDATPPIDLIKIVLDSPDLEVYGGDEVLDYRSLNPNNKVIQVLDSTVSKKSLSNNDFQRFYEILEFIGDKAKSEFSGRKILVVTYQDTKDIKWSSMAKEWLSENYPKEYELMEITHMQVGTNAYEDFTVQFLISGVYLNGLDYFTQGYKIKTIANYWNRIKVRPEMNNPFPYGIDQTSSITPIEECVKRIEIDPNEGAGLYEYPTLKRLRPLNDLFYLVERFSIAKTQQSLRLRYNDSRERTIYIFGNYQLPSWLITESVLIEDLLGYIWKEY